MRKYILLSAAASLVLASCTSLVPERDGQAEGKLDLSVAIDATKSAMDADELLSTAQVRIYKADFSGMVRSYVYSEAPQTIYLPSDSYRVDIIAGEAAKSSPSVMSWEQKSYKGSKEFEIVAGQTSTVQVEAKVSNVVTCVSFDSTVAENLNAGYTFTVCTDVANAASAAVYDASKSGSEAYFIVSGFEPSLYWSFEGVLAKDGSPVEKSGEIKAVEGGKLYKMTPVYTVKDGDLVFDLKVDYSAEVISDIIVFEPVSTGLSSSKPYEIWAGHATLHADVDESEFDDPSKICFSWSANGTDWESKVANRVSEGVYDLLIDGLSADTSYQVKLVIDGNDVGDSMTIVTDKAPQMPNSGFEVATKAESNNWTSFFDPSSSDPSLQSKFWDSGSSASAGMLGATYAICYSDASVPEGIGSTKSARLQSLAAAGKLAAGNLFTGEFAGLDGMNGKVNFGRPWTSRPTAVRFWYKYKGGVVDKTASGAGVKEGDYDICAVQVALGTWSNKTYGGSKNCPVQVNTSKKETFWSYPDLPETIAYGKFEETGTGNETEWKQVTIKFDYYSLTEYPAYIVFSGAASKYGDYFAGSSSSALWIDEVELLYE